MNIGCRQPVRQSTFNGLIGDIYIFGDQLSGSDLTRVQDSVRLSMGIGRDAIDTDGDGLSDQWEETYFGNNDGVITQEELEISDGLGDFDGDGTVISPSFAWIGSSGSELEIYGRCLSQFRRDHVALAKPGRSGI